MPLAYWVHDLSPFLIRFSDNVGIRYYGLAYMLGFAGAVWLLHRYHRAGRSPFGGNTIGDLITYIVFGVMLGGRLGYFLLYQSEAIFRDPLALLRVWEGGMASHGGFVGVLFALILFARRHHVSFFPVSDLIATTAALGLFFGRVANFINGELYGRPATVPWAVYFPKELYASDAERVREVLVAASAANPQWGTLDAVLENAGRPELRGILEANLSPRHPSQIYEGLLEGALLFSILWILRTRFRLPDGVLTGVFFIAYAVLRIVGEFFREPDAPLTGMFTRGQFLSLFLVLMGVGFLIAAKARPTWAPKFR